MGRMLGEKLALTRVEKDMKVAELARKADISPSHIHRIEDGSREPSYKILVRIAKALNEDVNVFNKIQMLDKSLPAEGIVPSIDDNSRSVEDIRKGVERRMDSMSKADLEVLDSFLDTYFFPG